MFASAFLAEGFEPAALSRSISGPWAATPSAAGGGCSEAEQAQRSTAGK